MKQELPNITFIEGFPPDFLDRINPQQRSLLVPDDMTTSLVSDVSMTELFSKTRHLNLSIIFLLHNLFAQGKSMRTVHLNTNYYVIFNSPRDRSQIMTLARQMHPGVGKFMIAAYNDATKRPFGYLLIDVRSNTPEEYRLRANIFPGETQYAYVKREYKKTWCYNKSSLLTMSQVVKGNVDFLKVLSKCSAKQRKAILQTADTINS